MAKSHYKHSGGSHRGEDPSESDRRERIDDPKEHIKIEKRRFLESVPATPELYARAREQWYKLPGSLVRPPMDPSVHDPGTDKPGSPEKSNPGGKRTGR